MKTNPTMRTTRMRRTRRSRMLEDAREIFGFTGDDIELEGYDEQPFIIFE